MQKLRIKNFILRFKQLYDTIIIIFLFIRDLKYAIRNLLFITSAILKTKPFYFHFEVRTEKK